MNKVLPYIFLLFAAFSHCLAQDDFRKSFFDFASSSRKQYKEYSKEAGSEFARALQENWNAFKVFDSGKRPFNPAPDTLVSACPVENKQIDISDIPVGSKTAGVSSKPTNAAAVSSGSQIYGKDFRDIAFHFYGVEITCRIPAEYGKLRLDGYSEKSVGHFWEALSTSDVDIMMASVRSCRDELNLNDWALFEFVAKLSSELYPDNLENEEVVFTVFCMNRMGLNCRIARVGSALIPLFAAGQEIYGRKYVVVGGRKYYLAGAELNVSSLNTYTVNMPGASSDLDMNIVSNPKIGGGGELRTVSSSVINGSLQLPIDSSLISFYRGYPQLDVNVYAAAEPDGKFSQALMDSLKPKLSGRSGVEAVNILLSFVQKDFRYRTDTDQFGKEKPYFCEENFYYPYNDCEDRAVLFSFLVRRILGYDCLLLQYSDHVNCAVRIGEGADGYYVRRGDSKYYVCDPTCQGAKVGMSGKNYRVKPQKVWIL